MKIFVVFVQLLLWAVCTNALFIWEPCRVDGSCGDEAETGKRSTVDSGDEVKRSPVTVDIHRVTERKVEDATEEDVLREARWLSRKYVRHRSTRLPARVANKRDNQYAVVEPKKPELSNAVGIYQDGKDYAYFLKVQLGSTKEPMYMLLDTGAGTTWVMGSDCTADPCTLHDTFDLSKSTTAKGLDSNFSVNYGSGSVTGPSVEDSIHLGDFDITMKFGVADHTSDDFKHFPFDGILGMSMTETKTETFAVKLKESGKLKSNVFSVYLNRGSSGQNEGELTLGGINEKKYTGEISYTNVPQKTTTDWAIPLDDLGAGDKTLGIKGRLGYIDTGTSFIFGPPEDAKALHGLIQGASSSDGVNWKVPCDTTQSITFTFSGKSYNVQPADWISGPPENGLCKSNIYGHEVVPNSWLLGAVFLKNVYAVFDMDELKIGFGSRSAEAPAPPPSSSTENNQATTASPASVSTTAGVPPMGVGGPETSRAGGSSGGAEEAAATAESANSSSKSSQAGLLSWRLPHNYLWMIVLAVSTFAHVL